MNHKPTKYFCDYCGDPVVESLIMVDGFLRYNSLACANCTDYDEVDHDQLEHEEDYDKPYTE